MPHCALVRVLLTLVGIASALNGAKQFPLGMPPMPAMAPPMAPQWGQWGMPAPAAPQWGMPAAAPQWGMPAQASQYGMPAATPQWGMPAAAPQWGMPADPYSQQWGMPQGMNSTNFNASEALAAMTPALPAWMMPKPGQEHEKPHSPGQEHEKPHSPKEKKFLPPSPELAEKAANAVQDQLAKISSEGTGAVYNAANAVFDVLKEWREDAAGQIDVTDSDMNEFTHTIMNKIEKANADVKGFVDKGGIRDLAVHAAEDALKSTECHATDPADCGTAQYKAWTAKVTMLSDLGMGPERADAQKTQDSWDSYVEEVKRTTHDAVLQGEGQGPDEVRKATRDKLSDTSKKLFHYAPMSNAVAEVVKNVIKGESSKHA